MCTLLPPLFMRSCHHYSAKGHQTVTCSPRERVDGTRISGYGPGAAPGAGAAGTDARVRVWERDYFRGGGGVIFISLASQAIFTGGSGRDEVKRYTQTENVD